jgi:uncharacterized membrane protein
MTDIILIALGIVGFLLCLKIHLKKRSDKPLVCPITGNCDSVIKSKYSTLLGIPLEYFGMLYYGIVVVSYCAMLGFHNLRTEELQAALIVASSGAFLFSIYLIGIQAFKLKSWCVWCLTSAGLSTAIAITSYIKLALQTA